MTTTAAFERQKAIGDVAEMRVTQAFFAHGWAVKRRPKGRRNDLEVTLPTGTEILEVKNEDRWPDSRSLCVELFQGLPPRPAGLKTSEATVYVHTLGSKCFAYRTRDMALHIESGLRTTLYRTETFRGADNNNGGVLVDKLVLMNKPWAELLDLADLPNSRVFKAARE